MFKSLPVLKSLDLGEVINQEIAAGWKFIAVLPGMQGNINAPGWTVLFEQATPESVALGKLLDGLALEKSVSDNVPVTSPAPVVSPLKKHRKPKT